MKGKLSTFKYAVIIMKFAAGIKTDKNYSKILPSFIIGKRLTPTEIAAYCNVLSSLSEMPKGTYHEKDVIGCSTTIRDELAREGYNFCVHRPSKDSIDEEGREVKDKRMLYFIANSEHDTLMLTAYFQDRNKRSKNSLERLNTEVKNAVKNDLIDNGGQYLLL